MGMVGAALCAAFRQSWGIGDFADLRELGRWSAQEFKAGVMLLINPLGATAPLFHSNAVLTFPAAVFSQLACICASRRSLAQKRFSFRSTADRGRRQGS